MFRTLSKQFRAIRMLSGTPHSIALGAAIGLFIAWTPTVGIHMILVVALAAVLRASKAAALIAVYVSNPLTMVPMFWIEYKLGAMVMEVQLTYEELKTIAHARLSEAIWKLCVDLAVPMWLGGTVLGLACAVPGYYLTRWAVERFRRRVSGVPTSGESKAEPAGSL